MKPPLRDRVLELVGEKVERGTAQAAASPPLTYEDAIREILAQRSTRCERSPSTARSSSGSTRARSRARARPETANPLAESLGERLLGKVRDALVARRPSKERRVRQLELTERILRLRGVPTLRSLPASELAQLARSMRTVDVQAGEILLREDEPPRSFYLLTTGTVTLRRKGKRIGTVRGPGGVGFMSFLARHAGGTSAVAESFVEALEVQADAMDEIFEDHFPVLLGHDPLDRGASHRREQGHAAAALRAARRVVRVDDRRRRARDRRAHLPAPAHARVHRGERELARDARAQDGRAAPACRRRSSGARATSRRALVLRREGDARACAGATGSSSSSSGPATSSAAPSRSWVFRDGTSS